MLRRIVSGVVGVAATVGVLYAVPAPGGEGRPSEADLRACHERAREQAGPTSYVERTPTSPFPSRISGVGPWTGPVTGVPPPRVTPRRDSRPSIPSTPPTGVFGAGGQSDEGSSEEPVDPRYREAFNACMRALGY